MIKHVVLYKFNPQISEEEINEIINNFNKCKEALENRLIEIEFGKTVAQKKSLIMDLSMAYL